MKRHVDRADGSPKGTTKIVKKPKDLSWPGHREALRASAPAAAVGRGKTAYRQAALQILQVERLMRDKAGTDAKLRGMLAEEAKLKGRPKG